jgi:hypothetical protein
MRDLLKILENLQEATKAESKGPQTLFSKGLTPTEINKDPRRWTLLIQKITTNQPFVDNVTGEAIYINPEEAKRLTKMKKDGTFTGTKTTIITKDGEEIPMGQLAKNEEFGGSTKESVLLKPSLIKITDRDIPATDLYETIAGNQVLQSTDYGRVVIQLAQYIISAEHCQLPPELLTKEREPERKAIVDYAGEYLGVLALLYGRTRFPRKTQFLEWLGGDIGDLTLNFPSAANNNIADSYATITNPGTSHSLNISSKGTGGGAAPAISGLKISPEIKRNAKLKNAVTLIELCQAGRDETGPSTIVQAFRIMDFLYSVDPSGIPKEWHKFLPFGTKAPKLQQQCIESINSIKGQKNEKGIQALGLPKVYQPLINDINSEKASDGGKMIYKIKKTIAQLVNSKKVIPEFADTILQVLEMNFIQQYTDYHPNGEITFATQWPSKLEGVVSMENKSSAIDPSSAGFSFKLGRTTEDYDEMGPDGPEPDSDEVPNVNIPDVAQNIAEPTKVNKLSSRVEKTGNVGRSERGIVKKRT